MIVYIGDILEIEFTDGTTDVYIATQFPSDKDNDEWSSTMVNLRSGRIWSRHGLDSIGITFDLDELLDRNKYNVKTVKIVRYSDRRNEE